MYRNDAIKNPKEWLTSLFTDLEYNNLYRYNQETDNNKEITKVKEFAGRAKRAISGAQRIKILEVTKEIKTKLDIETKLVTGIKMPLDIKPLPYNVKRRITKRVTASKTLILLY